MAGPILGVLGDILITSGASLTLTNEAMTNQGDDKTYNITNAAHRYLDRSSVPVVQTQTNADNVTWATVSPTTYTLRYLSGQVVHNAPLVGGTKGTRLASGAKYFAYASMGQTTDWVFAGARDLQDVSVHTGPGGSTWKVFQPLLLTGPFSLKKWWVDVTMASHLTASDLFILSLLAASGNRYEAYGYFKDDHLKAVVNAVVDETINFQPDGVIVIV